MEMQIDIEVDIDINIDIYVDRSRYVYSDSYILHVGIEI